MRHAAFVYAVEEDSREHAWAASFLPNDRLVPYALTRPLGAFPTVASILSSSTLADALHRHDVGHLLFTTGWNASVDAWADVHGITLVAPSKRHRRDLEDKAHFHRYLAKLGLPQSEGELATLIAPRDWSKRWVVQSPRSSGGDGTWFIDHPEDLVSLVEQRWVDPRDEHLIRRFVDGVPLGITLHITDDRIALSALRRQCYFEPTDRRSDFAGIQWLPTHAFTARAQARMNDVFATLASILHADRFRGQAHIDFMLDHDDEVFILEANPRMSAASPHLFLHPELLSLPDDPTRQLLDAWLAPAFAPARAPSHTPALTRIPPSSFEGATLDLLHPHTPPLGVRHISFTFYPGLQSGPAVKPRPHPDPRDLAAGTPFVHIPLDAGTALEPGCCLANVIADDRLYDDAGRINALGQRWLAELSRALLAQ